MINKIDQSRLVRERLLIALITVKLIDSSFKLAINVLSVVGLFYLSNDIRRKMAA